MKNLFHHDKPINKKKAFFICLGACIPIALGAVAGVVVNTFFLGPANKTDYTGINAGDLKTDTNSLMERYQNAIDNNYAIEEVFKPYEVVNISYLNYSSHEKTQSVSSGMIHAGAIVTQSLRNFNLKINKQYVEESISKSSVKNLATRIYMDEDETLTLWEGTPLNDREAEYKGYAKYALEEFTNVFGRSITEPSNYIISKKTIIPNTSTINKTNDGYEVSLKMRPIESVVNYAKQIKNLSHLLEEPTFNQVNLNFKIDNNLLIKQLDVSESYYATTEEGLGSPTDAEITVKYEVDGDFVIPTKDQPFNYLEN